MCQVNKILSVLVVVVRREEVSSSKRIPIVQPTVDNRIDKRFWTEESGHNNSNSTALLLNSVLALGTAFEVVDRIVTIVGLIS